MERRPSPVFSVIVPTYNRAHLLPRAIRSVLGQAFEDFELIVIDDGSTDDTRAAVARFEDPRIRYAYQENRGVSAARNAGAALARGRYLTFLDSDDEAFPQWLKRFEEMLGSPNAWVGCCGILKIEGQGQETSVMPRELGAAFDHQRGLFLAGSFALRRELFGGLGGYVEGLRYSENTELALRIVRACTEEGGAISTTEECVCTYHKQPFIKSGHKEEFQTVLEATEYLLRRHGHQLEKDRKLYAAYCRIAGVNAARLDSYDSARRWFAKSLRAHPWHWQIYGQMLMTFLFPLGRRVWHRRWAKEPRKQSLRDLLGS